jgi:hypothetical protein
MGAELIAEPMLQKRRARLSEESYAKGPQLDAAKEAQRLGIALNPSDIQPSATSRLLTAAAGERGQQAITDVNKVRVREVALKELGLPTTTPLNSSKAFDQARAQVAKPYEDVSKLPTMTADDQLVARLESFRVDPNVIGSKEYAPSIDKIVDDAIAKTQSGLTGAQLLKSVQVLRERARKTYNNRSATIEATDIADTNLAVANALESMVESNIFNPRLLSEFRDARQKMARAYAYEGATDFNTGVVDVGKLSRITAKDSMLTGDIAALGRVAGNFPDAFTTSVASPMKTLTAIGRTGVAGTLGGVAGYLAGQDYLSAALGSVAGAGVGRVAESIAANRLASPGYQAGLRVPDYRIPVNQLAVATAPIPQNRAIVPYETPTEVLMPGQGPYRPNFTIPTGQPGPRATFVGPEGGPPQLAAPSAESTMAALRAEDVRRAGVSRAIGKEAEARQSAAEAAARRPAAGEVILDFDPVTGRFREASQGLKGATPETFRNFGADLASAADKVTAGRRFDLTASEKVAWERTKVDLAEVAPGMKALSDEAIAGKMADRQWVQQTIKTAQEKEQGLARREALLAEQLANRNNLRLLARDIEAKNKELAKIKEDRARMAAALESLEDRLRAPRPVELGGQGPKTRAAQRNQLRPASSENKLIVD